MPPLLLICALSATGGVWSAAHHEVPFGPCLFVGACLTAFAAVCVDIPKTRTLLLALSCFFLSTANLKTYPKGPLLSGHQSISGQLGHKQDGFQWLHTREGPVALVSDWMKPGQFVHVFGRARRLEESLTTGARSRIRSAQSSGIRSVLFVDRVAVLAKDTPQNFSSSRHSAFLNRLVHGNRSESISEEKSDLLLQTGTRHILAISGMHVGLVATVVGGMLRLFLPLVSPQRRGLRDRWIPALFAGGAAGLYVHAAGWPVSATRALLIACMTSICWWAYRPHRPWRLYSIAMLLTVFFSPEKVRSLSFGLSFSAVAGVIVLSQRFAPSTGQFHASTRWLTRSMIASVGAQAGSLAWSAWVFQEFALTGAFANLWALPILGFWILPAALTASLGVDQAIAVADVGVDALFWGLELLKGPLLHPAVGPYGAVGLLVSVALLRFPVSALVLIVLCLGLKKMPAYGLKIRHMSVGQGDAALVEFQGKTLLVDTGPHSNNVLETLRRLGIHRIDAIVLSHSHRDHIQGTESLLHKLKIGCIEWPRETHTPPIIRDLKNLALQQSVPSCGGHLPWQGARILQFTPKTSRRITPNNHSLIVEMEAEEWRMLFAGDIEADAEKLLADQIQDITWLKVAHHGSRSSTSHAFLEAIQPAHCVISSGANNPFGHPHPETLARLRACRIHRTDRGRDVVLRVRGQKFWVH